MKLIRFGSIGNEKPGIHIDGKNYDLSKHIKDYDEAFICKWRISIFSIIGKRLLVSLRFQQVKELDLLLQDLLKYYVL